MGDQVLKAERQHPSQLGLRLSQSRISLQWLDTQQLFGLNGSQLIQEEEKFQINMSSQMRKMIQKDILHTIRICRLFSEKVFRENTSSKLQHATIARMLSTTLGQNLSSSMSLLFLQ